jgi:nucleoside-triphosphatase
LSLENKKAGNILLTGPPGCGKSTLIEKTVKHIQGPCIGFFTREIREGSRRTGFSINTLDGKQDVLAHRNIKSPFSVGKYGVNLEAVDQIAVPSITPKDDDALVVIDEIGKMECLSTLFQKTVICILEATNPVLGSVSLKGGPFIQGIKGRDDVRLIRVTEKNRDILAETFHLY